MVEKPTVFTRNECSSDFAKPVSWVAPLSCVTEADVTVTRAGSLPPPEAILGQVWCAS